MRFVKRVNERGTTTLPNEVRAALGIGKGDLVEFEVLGVIKSQVPDSETPEVPNSAPEGVGNPLGSPTPA